MKSAFQFLLCLGFAGLLCGGCVAPDFENMDSDPLMRDDMVVDAGQAQHVQGSHISSISTPLSLPLD